MKVSRRSWFGQSVLTALAALLPWKIAKAERCDIPKLPPDNGSGNGLYTAVNIDQKGNIYKWRMERLDCPPSLPALLSGWTRKMICHPPRLLSTGQALYVVEGTDIGIDKWSPLDTGTYTRVFRREPGGQFVEIQWEAMKPGDEVIHFGATPDKSIALLCVYGVIHSIDQNGTITWNGPYTDITKL